MKRWACMTPIGLLAASLALAAEPVVLVRGTASVPAGPERNAAERTTALLSRWMSDIGVPHDVVSDEQLRAGLPDRRRIVILGYNPQPDPAELEALRSLVARGTRLLVFYGSDPALASLMDVRLGVYTNTADWGRWTRLRFLPGAPPGMPDIVRQSSRNLRPVYPLSPRSRVLAVWENEEGRHQDIPAWVATPSGYWMTHVLQDDGDSWNKRRMLLALLGSLMPELWPAAARQVCRQATAWPDASASAAPRDPVAQEAIARLEAMLSAGRYAEAVAESAGVRDRVVRAWLAERPLDRPSLRAVWESRGTGLAPGDWPRTCERLARSGITDLFVNMLWPAYAHYPSQVVPLSELGRLYGDGLRAALEAGRARGIRVHVWKVCWRLDGLPADRLAELRRAGRLQKSDAGDILPWLCPSHPDNLRVEKDAIRDLVRRYAVDGVHLDYIRYPHSRVCFCEGCRSRFEAQRRQPLARWPLRPSDGALWREYNRWRVEQIERLVRDVKAILAVERPGARLSAAVFGRYPTCVDSVAQDWADWLRKGLLDFVCPMNYTTDAARLREWVLDQMAMADVRDRIFPGIGVTATESRLDTVSTLTQMRIAREAGAQGWALFSLNGVLADEVLPYLEADAP